MSLLMWESGSKNVVPLILTFYGSMRPARIA